MKSFFYILFFALISITFFPELSSSQDKLPFSTDSIPSDMHPIKKPENIEYNSVKDKVNRLASEPIVDFFDVSRQLRSATGNRIEALNVNSFGETPNSSWFTNRMGLHILPIDSFLFTPPDSELPDTANTWVLFHAKSAGVNPGFEIRDSRGHSFLIKPDYPKQYPELSTGAEMITTHVFKAAGYNVPQNSIVIFDPSIIRIAKGVKYQPRLGTIHTMTRNDLDSLLDMVAKRPDGKIRAVASRLIDGIVVGNWKYHGTREDDPNDFVPHQHRRELRGMYVVASWLNYFDNTIDNTLDVFDTSAQKNYIVHYMLDFNSSLGSCSSGPVPPVRRG